MSDLKGGQLSCNEMLRAMATLALPFMDSVV